METGSSSTLRRETPRLILRLLDATDRDAWTRAHRLSGEHFERWLPKSEAAKSPGERFDSQLERALKGVETDARYSFVGEHRGDGELVAFCGLAQVFRGPFQNAYASWSVSRPYAKQGYGVEAVGALLDIAFASQPGGLGLHRVQANIIPSNEPSLRLARRAGFREEGYAKAYLEIAGRWQDHVMFAMVAEEWKGIDDRRSPTAD